MVFDSGTDQGEPGHLEDGSLKSAGEISGDTGPGDLHLMDPAFHFILGIVATTSHLALP